MCTKPNQRKRTADHDDVRLLIATLAPRTTSNVMIILLEVPGKFEEFPTPQHSLCGFCSNSTLKKDLKERSW